MKKILLPLDGTDRSLNTITWIQKNFKKNDVELYLITVLEDFDFVSSVEEAEEMKEKMNQKLKEFADLLEGYYVKFISILGRAGKDIVDFAESNDVNMIVMTKSTRPGWVKILGSVTTYVVQHAKCDVMIISEKYDSKL